MKNNKKNPYKALISDYNLGNIDKYEFIDKINKFNKTLYYISERLKETDIKKIEIFDNNLIFTTRKDNLSLYFNGRDRRGVPFDILNFGHYEEEDNYLVFQCVNDGDIIFDIGANIGWYSLLFSKYFSKAKIFSFEPIYETFKFLKNNIKLNNANNIQAFNYGISNLNGKGGFYYCPEGSVIASQKNLVNSDIAKLIDCDLVTLDRFVTENKISQLDFLKCDIEGGELFALQGGKNAIERFLPIIFVELFHLWTNQFDYHPNDIIYMLKIMGYRCYVPMKTKMQEIENLDVIPKNETLNYFFLHNKKHKKLINRLT